MVPTAGNANTDVLKYWLNVRWPLGRTGLPVAITRAPSPPPVMFRLFVVPRLTLSGVPEMKDAIPEISQLSNTERLSQFFHRRLTFGTFQTQSAVKRWRISRLLGP